MNYSTQKQPAPVSNSNEPIANLVIEDLRRYGGHILIPEIEARAEQGLSDYGTPLQAHNGRDSQVEALQEAIDLVKYLRQAIEEGNTDYLREYLSAISIADIILNRLHRRDDKPLPTVDTYL